MSVAHARISIYPVRRAALRRRAMRPARRRDPLLDGVRAPHPLPSRLRHRPLQLPLHVLHAGGAGGRRIAFHPRAALLTFEELERIVGVFARLGVRKLRLTGGEPTVRHGIVELVRRLAAVPGIEQVVMTSNGHLLGELAAPLAAAGLSAINISLDTLDPARFHAITGRGDLARVLAGIDAARAAGLRVKTNAVALRGVNDGELVALCEDAWRRGAVPRFIEHMPMSDGALYADGRGISAATIRRTVEAALGPLVPADARRATPGRRATGRSRPIRARSSASSRR